MDLTGRKAAALGAAHGAAGAVGLLAGVAAVRAGGSEHWSIALFEVLFDPTAFGPTAAYNLAAVVIAAAAVGAPLGALARRVSGSARRRVLVLAVATLPALYLAVALALTILAAPQVAREWLVPLALVPLASLLYAVVGTLWVAPVAILPALAVASMLEGATRPSQLEQGGLANPVARRRIMQCALMATAALLAFAFGP